MNNPFAICSLGVCYHQGNGVRPNLEKSIELFKHAAKLNNPRALLNLGVCYSKGEGLERNSVKGFKYFTQSAKLNDPAAFYNLGFHYENGEGVEQDFIKAAEYYKLSANFDHIDAIFNLARLFYYGEGINQDYKKAVELYHRIIDLDQDSETYFILFGIYSSGNGIERNILQSIQFLIKSAHLDYSKSFVQIGLFLLNGNFTVKNEKEAVSYFKKSSEKYEFDGMFWYGFCLIEGKGISKNFYLGKDFICLVCFYE
jgi:TPR repeat protein